MPDLSQLALQPINMRGLRHQSETGELVAIKIVESQKSNGYLVVAVSKRGAYLLHKTKSFEKPRVFNSLDSAADNCRLLNIPAFSVFIDSVDSETSITSLGDLT